MTTKKTKAYYHRCWMGTINKPVINLEDYFKDWFQAELIVFGTGQTEIGERGTRHHQFYIVTRENPRNTKGYTLSWLKTNLHGTAHWEPRRGTHEQAVEYCNKADTRELGPWTIGEWSDTTGPSHGGERGAETTNNKIIQIRDKLIEGETLADLTLDNTLGSSAILYSKHFEKFLTMHKAQSRSWPTHVAIFYGPSGTGKSTRALEFSSKFQSAFWYRPGNHGNTWFDGYSGQECVVFDEFTGSTLKATELLRLIDRYPYNVETKGSSTPFLAKWIVITSNFEPKDWWHVHDPTTSHGEKGIKYETWQALERRIREYGVVHHMTDVKTPPPPAADYIPAADEFAIIEAMPLSPVHAPAPFVDLTDSEEFDDDGTEELGAAGLLRSMEKKPVRAYPDYKSDPTWSGEVDPPLKLRKTAFGYVDNRQRNQPSIDNWRTAGRRPLLRHNHDDDDVDDK